MFSESQVRDHGLWCQVREENNAGMGSDIGDWYYPPGATPDGFTLATTSSLPYQSLECTNTIGLLRIGSLANNQGIIVRCNTTITSGLDRTTITSGSPVVSREVIRSHYINSSLCAATVYHTDSPVFSATRGGDSEYSTHTTVLPSPPMVRLVTSDIMSC